MPFHFDQHLSARVRTAGKSTLPLWIFFASYGVWLFVPLIMVLALRGLLGWQSIVIPVFMTHILTLLLQQLVGRERPPLSEAKIQMWRRTPSFPSAHASGSMACALGVSVGALPLASVGVAMTLFACALAVFVGISRIVVGVHYVTDVLCGWIFGAIVTGIFLIFA